VYAGGRSDYQAGDPPQGHRRDRAAGPHRAGQAAQGSVGRPCARVRRDHSQAARRV